MKLTNEQLLNLLCTATYGSEWLEVKTLKAERHLDGDKDFECREDRWVNRLLNGGRIVCLDWYADDEPDRIYLTLEDVEKGLDKAYKEYPRMVLRALAGDGDYYDAMNIMQYIMFGELVYG